MELDLKELAMSFVRWATSVAVVAFSWVTLPIVIFLGAIEAYRVEDPLLIKSVPKLDERSAHLAVGFSAPTTHMAKNCEPPP